MRADRRAARKVIARIGPFLTPFALVIAVLVALVPVAAFAADKQRVALVIGNAAKDRASKAF
jgi:hypothetical protein